MSSHYNLVVIVIIMKHRTYNNFVKKEIILYVLCERVNRIIRDNIVSNMLHFRDISVYSVVAYIIKNAVHTW